HVGGRPRARARRPGAGGWGGGRARGGEEPPLPRARRTGPGPGHPRGSRPLRCAREDDPVPAGPRADARLLRDHGPGRRRGSAAEDRRQDAAARQGADRCPAAPVRLPRRVRPGGPVPTHGSRGAAAPAPRAGETRPHGPEPPRAGGAAVRGPPLDRRRERAVRRGAGRCGARDARPPAAQLPTRVPRGLDAEVLLPATPALAARRGGEPRPEAELAAALRALAQAELVYETALYPQAEYAFKHPLTQEVAYGTQLGERRRLVHAAVARALEATSPEKLDEQAALLAHHWERAGEALTAADWHRRAAEWAGARDREAMNRHWARVRELLADVPASPETLALGLVARTRMLNNTVMLGDVGVGASVLFAEGMELAARLEGAAPRVILLSQYGAARVWSSRRSRSRGGAGTRRRPCWRTRWPYGCTGYSATATLVSATPGTRSTSSRRPGAGFFGCLRWTASRGLTSSEGNGPRRPRPPTAP